MNSPSYLKAIYFCKLSEKELTYIKYLLFDFSKYNQVLYLKSYSFPNELLSRKHKEIETKIERE